MSGDSGILINITAGLDFAIDEYEIIGNAVEAFDSENATVVVGTVIDPELTDEVRVTVVATGIGAERKPDISLVNDNSRVSAVGREYGTSSRDNKSTGGTDGNQALKLDDEAPQPSNELEYLDIPAFLRKQAD